MSIDKKIIMRRKSLQWSQSELSRKSGLTSAAISQLEKGGREPTFKTLKKLCIAFNCSIGELHNQTIYKLENEFYAQFKQLEKLPKTDQQLILQLVKRLAEAKDAV